MQKIIPVNIIIFIIIIAINLIISIKIIVIISIIIIITLENILSTFTTMINVYFKIKLPLLNYGLVIRSSIFFGSCSDKQCHF